MTSAQHGKQVIIDGLHGIVAYEYADSTARLAATGFDDGDLYKIARDLDTGYVFILTNISPITWGTLSSGSGAGDVVGPSSATDNAIARFDGTGGKTIQNSLVTISDNGVVTISPSTTTAPIIIGSNGQGQLVTGLNADSVDGYSGPYFLNASNLETGIVPAARFNDTTHGSRAGGSLHSDATTGASGFMSASDKTKLNGIATGATSTPLTNAAPANVTKATAAVGVSTDAARADHKHDVSTATASSLTVGGSNAEGSSSNLSRADHVHSLPAFGSSAGTFTEGNDSRLSDDRVASGLRSATTVVSVSAATAPTTGQALIATGASAATWQSISLSTLPSQAALTVVANATNASASPTAVAAASANTVFKRTSSNTLAFATIETADVGDNQITLAKLATQSALSVLANATNSTAVPAALVAGSDGQVLRRSGTTLVFDTVTAAGLASDSVTTIKVLDANITLPKLATQAANTIVANATGGSASPTATKLTSAMIDASAFGTSSGTITQGNDSRLSDDRTASGIRTATTIVVVSAATAPTNGQVLTATSGTAATWQTPSGGGVPTSRTLTAGAGLTGGGDLSADRTFDVVANADGSIIVNTNDIQVGVLANDTQHGNRGNGSLHSVADGSNAGFMSSANFTKLSGIATGATNTPLTNASPATTTKATAVVGVSTDAARADHKHDISTAAASSLTVGGSNAEGSATSLARSDHTHSLPAFGSSAGTFTEGNDSRLTNDRTASGLRSATTVVAVSSATAPTSGQVLTATSGTAATWQAVSVTSLSTDLDCNNNVLTEVKRIQFNGEVSDGSLSGSTTLNFTTGSLRTISLTGNTTITSITFPGVGHYQLVVVNTGSFTLALPSSIKFPGGGTDPVITASSTDIINFYYNGTTVFGQFSQNFV